MLQCKGIPRGELAVMPAPLKVGEWMKQPEVLGCGTGLNESSYFTLWAGHKALNNMVLVLCHQSQEAQQILTYRHTFSWVNSSNTLYFLREVQHIDPTAITRQRDRIQISSVFLCTEKPFHPMGHRWMTYTSRYWYVYLSQYLYFPYICVYIQHSFPHDYCSERSWNKMMENPLTEIPTVKQHLLLSHLLL